MIWSRLFRARKPAHPPGLPEGVRVYAIGDIHGRDDLLGALHDAIARDLAAHPCRGRAILIHLGDYVDRGPASRAVLDRLCGPPPAGVSEMIHLAGNHDEVMLRFLEDPTLGRLWLQWGGDATLASYGVSLTPAVDPEQRFDAMRRDLAEALPRAHRSLLMHLPASHRLGDYLFVHAGVRPGRALDRQLRDDLLWIRDDFVASRAWHGAMIVHGHHVTATVDEHPNRIGIDTGAFASGRLSAIVLEAQARRYLAATP